MMSSELEKALAALDLPVDWIGLRHVKETNTRRRVRDGLPKTNRKSTSQGVMVEVLVNGQIGYGATHSLQIPSIQAAAASAYQQAIAAGEWATHGITTAQRPPVRGQYRSPVRQPLDSLSPGEVNEVLVKLCQTLKVSDQIVQTSAEIIATETESWFVSSNGSEVYQQVQRVATDYEATAQAGAIVQKRTNNGWLSHSYQGGLEYWLEPNLWERAQQIGEQAVELLTAEECPSTTTTLVLAPDQMMLQIHESVGHPLELDRILGDERNYAGGSFVKPEDFGSLRYGSPLMTITFDPTVPEEYASYGFDDTGVAATREYLIQEGVLLRGLGSLESQARSQVPGVACARACSWNRPPIDRIANLNLEPGETPFEQLIAGIEHGVYMTANQSWSIDDQRYKFQFGCEYAKLIENGRFTKTLRNPNYRGTTPEFWQSLTQVGDRNTWELYGTPACGKGEPNQTIWVGHGSPVCVFDNMEVFGGGT
ncbi:MAG: TldD/PmbA family protein [Leptolyngbyaceae bacterium]|nr:TldD/PmbA family protein [Leptolyngbyaceae bacterium]